MCYEQASLVAQRVKNLPAIQETQVRYLSREDPLEKGLHAPAFFRGKETRLWEGKQVSQRGPILK